MSLCLFLPPSLHLFFIFIDITVSHYSVPLSSFWCSCPVSSCSLATWPPSLSFPSLSSPRSSGRAHGSARASTGHSPFRTFPSLHHLPLPLPSEPSSSSPLRTLLSLHHLPLPLSTAPLPPMGVNAPAVSTTKPCGYSVDDDDENIMGYIWRVHI